MPLGTISRCGDYTDPPIGGPQSGGSILRWPIPELWLPLEARFSPHYNTSQDHRIPAYSPFLANPFPGKKFRARAKQEKSLLLSEHFDLTESPVAAIILCTSILWRADKPGARYGL